MTLVALVPDEITAHLGYDPDEAAARLRRDARAADVVRRMRSVRPPRIAPHVAYVPVHWTALPKFVLARARDKGIDL